jgi:hypothetical protein
MAFKYKALHLELTSRHKVIELIPWLQQYITIKANDLTEAQNVLSDILGYSVVLTPLEHFDQSYDLYQLDIITPLKTYQSFARWIDLVE